MKKIVIIAAILIIGFAEQSCNVVRDVSRTLANLKALQFQLHNVSSFQLSGISISNKSRVGDFSISDGLKLTNAISSKRLPATFTLNVLARNPNDGSGGTPSTSATITNIDWRLFIDDKPTVSGVIATPIVVPASGQETTIPVTINIDLYEFFGNEGYERIINLALALGGMSSNPARLKIDMKPTVNTSIGSIRYPGHITVVNNEWR